MSDASTVRTGIVALFCVFIATTQVLLLAQDGDRSPAGATQDADLDIHGKEVRALLREIRDSLRAGEPSAERDRTGQAGEPPAASRMDASEIPFDADLIQRLEQALGGFSVQIDRLAEFRGPLVGLRNQFTAGAEMASTNLRDKYSDYWAARKELLFLSYSGVLELLGPPGEIQSTGSGEVSWIYTHPNRINFVDGIVMYVVLGD